MAVKSDIITLRIEPAMRKELKALCKSHDCTMSDVMRDGIIHKTGGAIKLFEAPEPDKELANFFVELGGGSIVGILSYKAIYEVLKNKFGDKKDDGELQLYAVSGGLITAILSGYGIKQLMKFFK
jgi:hypothetical protein